MPSKWIFLTGLEFKPEQTNRGTILGWFRPSYKYVRNTIPLNIKHNDITSIHVDMFELDDYEIDSGSHFSNKYPHTVIGLSNGKMFRVQESPKAIHELIEAAIRPPRPAPKALEEE